MLTGGTTGPAPRAGKGELVPRGAGPAYIRAGEPPKAGTEETIARCQDAALRGGCVTRWNENIGRLLGPNAAADPARPLSHASSRRRLIRPRDTAIVLCTVLLIGFCTSTFFSSGQLTPLLLRYALCPPTPLSLP